MDAYGSKSRLVLFGAGASVPFFDPRLSTQFLTNTLSSATTWDMLLRRYCKLMKDTNEVDPNIIAGVLARLSARTPKLNFEEVIEVIDKIASFNFDSSDNKVFHTILSYFGAERDDPYCMVWDNVPFLCRQLIAEAIVGLEAIGKSREYNRLLTLQSDFFDFLVAEGATYLVSLNYDEIIPESMANAKLGSLITTGFESADDEFSVSSFFASKHTISYVHGHVRFTKDDGGIVLQPDGATANKIRWEHLSDITLKQTRTLGDSKYAYNFNTFLVTGQSKESTFDENPYAAYYAKLARDVFSVDEIVLIGYSFGDNHLNRLFLNFLGIKSSNTVRIVTYHPDPIDMIQDGTTEGSFIHSALQAASINNIPLKTPNGDYKYSRQVEEINRVGYGALAPRLHMYKKGYDQFLEEFAVVSLAP